MNELFDDQVIKVVKVLGEMLHDRGITTEPTLPNITDELCRTTANQRANLQIDVEKLTIVIYLMSQRHNVTTVKSDLKRRIRDQSHAILVFREVPLNVDSFKVKLKDDFPNVTFEMFDLQDLMFNVTHHVLVPKHERIHDNDTIRSVMKQYGIQRKLEFPIISKTDPVCRYFAVDAGDLVKIHRISPSGGVHISYRLCV